MTNLILIETLAQNLDTINIIPGQVIYCTDAKTAYYDNINNYRIDISYATIYVQTEKDKANIPNPLLNRIVIVGADKSINYFNGVQWNVLLHLSQLEVIVNGLNEYIPSVMQQDGKLLAPRTVADAVYTKSGYQVISQIEENKRLIETKVKNVYVQVLEDGQKLFVIPFPIDNFDFQKNYMQIIANGNMCDPDFYTVIGDHVLLNDTIDLKAGEMVLFIFYYQTYLNQNVGVVLDTDNYADYSITSSKLSPSIRVNANNVVENVQRIFFTPAEKAKLATVAEGATNFVMPDHLPATMITQDPDHRFVTDVQIANWNGKANASDVYTKQETDQQIENIVGAAPQALDTLKELAEALGNDPNFAGTITKELATKATVAQFQSLSQEVDKKTNINDYVRNGMYLTVSSTNQMQSKTLLTGSITDPTFIAYIDCMEVVIKMDKTNQYGDTSLQINNLAPQPIIGQMGYPLAPGDLVENSIYTLRYNGSTGNFILQGKGGVNLVDTLIENFIVNAKENINRGQLVDVINDTQVASTIVRPYTLTTFETELADYSCDNLIKVLPIPGQTNQVLLIWLNSQVLKTEVVYITNDFIDMPKTRTEVPVVINSSCASFKAEIINGEIVIAYYTVNNNLTIKQIVVNPSNGQITFGNSYYVEENELVETLLLIPINGTGVCVYEHGKVTKAIYFSPNSDENHTLNIIRVRDNLGYPLNSFAIASNSQIIFTSSAGDSINGYVMALSANDFELSEQVIIVANNQYQFTDPVMTSLGNNQVLSTWTDTGKTKIYRQFLQLDYKGGIVYGEPVIFINDAYKVSTFSFPTQTHVTENTYISASSYNYEIPSINPDDKNCLKVVTTNINAETETYETIYTATPVLGTTPVKISSANYDNHKMIVAYTAKKPYTIPGDPNPLHIYFATLEVRKLPYGVAMTNAQASQNIKVSIW